MKKVNIDEAVASGTKYRQFVIQFYNDVASRLKKRQLNTQSEATTYLLNKEPFCSDWVAITLIVLVVILIIAVVIFLVQTVNNNKKN